jgi:hypothetical protein
LPFKSDYNPLEYQTPTPKIEVFFPENSSLAPDFTFSADIGKDSFSGLQSYNFTESVDDMDGSFTFTIINGEVFDRIPERSIVKIFEGVGNFVNYTSFPSFVGIIRRKKVNKQMSDKGLKKTFTFTGKSIVCCITEYTISLDMRINGVANATAKNNQMLEEINNIKNLSIKTLMIETWKYFKKISSEVSKDLNGVATIALEKIINKFIGSNPEDYITVTGAEQKLRYPMYGVLINKGNNTITEIWRNKLPKPVYELFAYCDKKGNPKIMARQVPFGDPEKNNCEDWRNLEIYTINPTSLKSIDLEQSDEEVYTAYASYIIGSQRDRNFYLAVNQDSQKDTTIFYSDKANIYGFKPLEINFNGYARKNNADKDEDKTLKDTMKALNKLASYWYSRNDEMYSGTITVITNFKNPKVNPRVGCRLRFLGGQFYIDKTDHSWNQGGTPLIKLSVSRGMVYGENGEMLKPLKNVGEKYSELDDIWVKPVLPMLMR